MHERTFWLGDNCVAVRYITCISKVYDRYFFVRLLGMDRDFECVYTTHDEAVAVHRRLYEAWTNTMENFNA